MDDKKYDFLEDKVFFLKRSHQKDTGRKKTYDEVFDERTLITLYKMMKKQNIDSIDHSISTGKEGNVFRATTDSGDILAVKIYRISTATFKNIGQYIIGDPRFRNIPKDHRRVICAWAQKEFKNLERCVKADVRVPKPIMVYDNILIMEHIGDCDHSAPILKKTMEGVGKEFFDQIYSEFVKMVKDARIVHGDFSEYNILNHEGKCYIIDLGQGVTADHPMAPEFLKRDIKNLLRLTSAFGVQLEEDEVRGKLEGPRAELEER